MIPILHRAEGWLLVDKPSGISIHCDDGQPGLMVLLAEQLNIDRCFPVHRLDKVTSGLLLVATSRSMAAELSGLFERRAIDKYYLALSDRKPKKKQGAVIGDMVPSRRGSWRLSNDKNNPAISQFFSRATEAGRRLFLLRPLTGRTHQLRVALKSLGAPIVGDSRYGGLPQSRCYLHAYALGFDLGGQRYQFVCPPSHGEHFTSVACAQLLAEPYAQPWLLAWPQVGKHKVPLSHPSTLPLGSDDAP